MAINDTLGGNDSIVGILFVASIRKLLYSINEIPSLLVSSEAAIIFKNM